MDEVWKPIVGLEDKYLISESGIVKRKERFFNRDRDGYKKEKVKIPEKILHGTLDKGYVRINLKVNDDGRRKRFRIHRLVALTFIGQPPNDKPHINHKDGVKNNNHYSNLEWCSIIENNKHALKNGLTPNIEKRSKHYLAKPINQLHPITNTFIKRFECMLDAKDELGIDISCIAKVCKGKRKSAGGYSWEYAE